MFHRLLDQIGQTQCSGGLQAVHSGRFTATDTLQKMLELGICLLYTSDAADE